MKIKSKKDLEYQLELTKIKRQVKHDKLTGSIQNAKSSIVPSLVGYAVSSIFKKRRKKSK